MLETNRTNTIRYCRNWQDTVSFYRDRLGLTINVDADWFVEFRLPETSFLNIADAAKAKVEDV